MSIDTIRPWVVQQDVEQAVQQMLDAALDEAAAKLPYSSRADVNVRLQRGNCPTCEYVHSALARAVAAYLGATVPEIHAIYSYNPEHAIAEEPGDARPPNAPVLNLLVHIHARNAALQELSDAVGTAVEQQLRRLPCTARAPGECAAVDVLWVDERDVAARKGYGALISSPYTRPIRLWPA